MSLGRDKDGAIEGAVEVVGTVEGVSLGEDDGLVEDVGAIEGIAEDS